MDSQKPFNDPFPEMKSDEKTKLILLLQEELAKARGISKGNGHNEILVKLDELQKGQSSYMQIIGDLTAIIKTLKKEHVELYQKVIEQDRVIIELKETLLRLTAEFYGSNAQK